MEKDKLILIAKFDGWYQDEKLMETNGDANWVHNEYTIKITDTGRLPVKSSRFENYKTHWVWLMPVVEKICHTKEFRGVKYFGMVDENGLIVVNFRGHRLFKAKTLIEATFEAVADFLEWYHNTPRIQDDNIHAPFTDGQVEKLKHYQEAGEYHPYTCGGEFCKRSQRED